MGNKQALRELQSRLAERLSAARGKEPALSWLAVESAGHGFLLPLAQAGEIFGLAPVIAVPHTRPWFLGVTNLRGGLFGVVDLAAFLGVPRVAADGAREQSRLVVFNPRMELNCALLVDGLAGLRRAEELSPIEAAAGVRPSFVGVRFADGAGRMWQELNLAALALDPTFMKIVE